VSWNTSQGRTRGRVVERRTSDFEFAGQHFTATSKEPAFIVESEKSGDRAAHKGSALRKLKS
jgi:hypothetical protein